MLLRVGGGRSYQPAQGTLAPDPCAPAPRALQEGAVQEVRPHPGVQQPRKVDHGVGLHIKLNALLSLQLGNFQHAFCGLPYMVLYGCYMDAASLAAERKNINARGPNPLTRSTAALRKLLVHVRHSLSTP